MIINGGSRCAGGFFSKHLVNPEKNERVKIVDIRGLSAQTVGGCFREMKAIASGTRTKNYFYHANINILAHEHLTPEQWEKSVDTLEKNLGLDGHARFVVEHDKAGRTHQHIVWLRIDVEKMRAVPMKNDYVKHQATARQLEKEFSLEIGKSVLGQEKEGKRPARRPKQWEVFRGKGSGIDPREMTAEITEIWNRGLSPGEFIAELEKLGCVLARGDRRNFCIVDGNGDVHSLARRIKGTRAAEINARLAGIDMKTLPNIKQAQEYQRGQKPQRAKEQDMVDKMDEQEKLKEDLQKQAERDEEQRQEGIKKDEEHRQQTIKDEQDRIDNVVREQERQKEALQKEAGIQTAEQRAEQQPFEEQLDRQLEQAREMDAAWQRLEDYKTQLRDEIEKAVREKAEREARAKELEIVNAGSRWGQAAAKHYDIRDPYQSLARSAMAEYGMFLKERQNIDQQIAKETDPKRREALELRKQIEGMEYMALTSRRIANQSEIIVGKLNSPEAKKERERAEYYTKQAQKLREEYRALYMERGRGEREGGNRQQGPPEGRSSTAEKEPPVLQKQPEGQETVPAHERQPEPARPVRPVRETPFTATARETTQLPEDAEKPILVEEIIPGKPRGNYQTLSSYVKTLPEKPARREYTNQEIRNNSAAKRGYYSQLIDTQNRVAALRNISSDMKAKRPLNAKDVRNLGGDDLKKIKEVGDGYLKDLVQEFDKNREKGRGLER